MDVFKSLSFYLCILGFVLVAIYTRETTRPKVSATFVQTPSSSPFMQDISAFGIIEGVDKNIEIGTPADGIVEELWFHVGDLVKKGDPLFQIDTRDLKADLIVLISNVAVAKADLKKQKDQLSRFESVKDSRVITQDELQLKQNETLIAEAKLKSAESEVIKTEALIHRLTVRAPKDGTILQQNIRIGEFVSRGKPVMVLGDLQHLQVRISIDEQNAALFTKNAKAVAFPKNNTNVMIPLKFVRIEPYVIPKKSLAGSSEERVDTRVLDVIYSFIPPEKYNIYVGQQVDVFIEQEGKQKSL